MTKEKILLTTEEKEKLNETKKQLIHAITIPDPKQFDKIMEFMIEYHRLHGRTASIIPSSAMIVSPGQWVLRRAIEIDDEHLIVELPENTTLKYFTHVKPSLGAIDCSLFQRNFFGRKKKGFWYNRCHLVIGHEPITRDFYSGRIADEQKKWQKLLEAGILIRADSQLARDHFTVDGKCESPTGYFIHPDKVELDEHGKPRKKFDISDIDAITAEVAVSEDKKLVENAIKAAMEAYDTDPNADLKMILIGVGVVIIVMSVASYYFMGEIAKTGGGIILSSLSVLRSKISFSWMNTVIGWFR